MRGSQAFAVYPVNSVGVMGDAPRYEHVIALRAVETVDFMKLKSHFYRSVTTIGDVDSS